MKLTVIHDIEKIDTLVPKISLYSNTQNKIQLADLAANEAPHPELHAISLRVAAPDPTGGSQQTYWFYEKSRGSFEETRNLKAKTKAQKDRYDLLMPKRQRFDKGLFGKVWNTYLIQPHLVSLGAQKNFARFNAWLRDQKDEDWESFFKKTVALLIMWKNTERIVRKSGYQGYHHNIITYTLSWLFHLTKSRVDLEKIWMNQTVSEILRDRIESLTVTVNNHIRDTERNISEWCKKEDCWNLLKEKKINILDDLADDLISAASSKSFKNSYLNFRSLYS